MQGDEEAHIDIIGAEQEAERVRAADVPRAPVDDGAPVPGAQWDEVHRRWERWDEQARAWVVVGDDAGDGVAPGDENPLPASLAREMRRADELEAADTPDVDDVDRAAEPPAQVPGAQWNEVAGRWERWDEAAGAWVEVPAE